MLSLGMTYDYYKVSGATANTYLNKSYYETMLDNVNDWVVHYEGLGSLTEEQQVIYESFKDEQTTLKAYKAAGWKQESKNEIESIYKSMGIRLGVNVKF